MNLSVAEVMALPILGSARLLTPAPDHRSIRWVSVIEAPVEDFVREDELVLTTAMGCKESEALSALVSDIAHAGAGALGIATGYYIEAIPPPVVDLAAARQLPLIQIPWAVRFSEISQAVSDALLAQQRVWLEDAKELQADVWSVILRRGSVDDVRQMLERRLLARLRIEEAGGVLVAGAHRHAEAGAATAPIHSALRLEGYVTVWPESPRVDAAAQAEAAASAMAVWYLYQEAERQRRFQSRDSLLWSLAYGEVSVGDVLERLTLLGYHPDREYVGLLGQVDTLGDASTPAPPDPAAIRAVHDLVAEAVARVSPATLYTHRQDTFLVYLESRAREHGQVARRFLDALDARMRAQLPLVVMSWGVGAADSEPTGNRFHNAYRQAHEALNIGYSQSGPGHRTFFADVRLYQMLLHLSQEPVAQELLAATLRPLQEYDGKRHGALVLTLSTFVQTRGQISETARLLNLHRQSLTYRLSQIERLTGRSLVDPDDWFLFSFALRILKHQEATAHLHSGP